MPALTPRHGSQRGRQPPLTTIFLLDETFSAPEPRSSRKRPMDEAPESNRKTAKVHHRSTPGGASGRGALRRPRTSGTEHQKTAYLQVGRYLILFPCLPLPRNHRPHRSGPHPVLPREPFRHPQFFGNRSDRRVGQVHRHCNRFQPSLSATTVSSITSMTVTSSRTTGNYLPPISPTVPCGSKRETSWSLEEMRKQGRSRSHTVRSSLMGHRWPDDLQQYSTRSLPSGKSSTWLSRSVGPVLTG